MKLDMVSGCSTREAIKRYQAVPVGFMGTAPLLAMADPTNILTIDEHRDDHQSSRARRGGLGRGGRHAARGRLGRMQASMKDIVEDEQEADAAADKMAEEADQDAPIIKLGHSIIAQAVAGCL